MGDRWIGGEFVYVTPDKANSLSANLARPGDIVFTQRGTLGQVALVPPSPFGRYLISQSQMKLTVDQTIADPLFLYYQFRSPEQQGYVRRNVIQTGVPHTNLGILRDTPIILPPLIEQQAIACILGALDDKIELNRRMNETLEAMARAIFKSWFVDFDPVRAKAAGQQPSGLAPHIADLFPDEFVESELGEIPKGWEVGTLGSMIETIKGRSYKSSELVESGTALVTLKSFARGGGYRPDGLKSYSGTYNPEQVIEPGEMVIACTDVTQAAEVIGHPAVVRKSQQFNTLVASLDTIIVRPRNDAVTRAFLYFLCGTDAFTAHTYAHTTGTTVLHLAKEAIPSFKFAQPPSSLVQVSDRLAAPILKKIDASETENDLLGETRDSLLPKLISGELRVGDAERFTRRQA
jgi:type I restriction enzyme S subunit